MERKAVTPESSPRSSPVQSPGFVKALSQWVYVWVGTNSGMDYWNGTLDWTTGMVFRPLFLSNNV